MNFEEIKTIFEKEGVEHIDSKVIKKILPIYKAVEKFQHDANLNKHIGLIHHRGDLDANPRKIMNIILKFADNQDKYQSETYRIPKHLLWQQLGWAKSDYKNLFDAFSDLHDKKIRWNSQGVDKKNADDWESIGQTSIISHFFIDKSSDLIEFSIPGVIREILKYPNIYARVNLNKQKYLTSKYELAWQEFGLGELYRRNIKTLITDVYSIPDIRAILNIPDNLYQNNPTIILKRCVKDPILKVSEKSEININIHEVIRISGKGRGGGRIIGLRLKIEFKEITKEVENNFKEITEEAKRNFPVQKNIDARKELDNIFDSAITNKIIKEVSQKRPDFSEKEVNDYIIKNIGYVKSLNKGEIQNFPGYVRKAIDENYAGNKQAAVDERNYQRQAQERRAREANMQTSMFERSTDTSKEPVSISNIISKEDMKQEKQNFFNNLPQEKQKQIVEFMKNKHPQIFGDHTDDSKPLITAILNHCITDDLKIILQDE